MKFVSAKDAVDVLLFQFDPEFQTPLILDESLDFSDPEESRFASAFSDGLLAKSEPILSMSAFQKPSQAGLLDYGSTQSLNDAASYSSYGQGPYVTTPLVPSPMAEQTSQLSDCVPYMPKQEYSSSYEESRSPMLSGNLRQLPEVISYTPQRGCEGTRVFVQIQSPYDLHSSSYAHLFLVFGTKRCECIPHFLGFHGTVFQYALSVDAPLFSSTGSPSFTVNLQLTMDGQNDCPSTTLQVGAYTYERASLPFPSDEQRKRRMSSYSDNSIARSAKRSGSQQMHSQENSDSFSYRDTRSASFSPYMQSVPAVSGFATPYQAASSPRIAPMQYQGAPTPQQSALRSQSPLTPSWSPSLIAAGNEIRNPSLALAQGLHQQKPPSPARQGNPTLIRTSTLQANGVSQPQSFNPYAIYPSKAVLKLNGDLDSMAENWTREECDAKRRLVHFTRVQNGSAIHADFRPVTPEDRAPNSICISCIYWNRKKECFITSVDTIYLLESLVGVRFTVEEKNRIRRNLEGFRPLTVSKAKADSEDFFKVIMGFPAPKPRNIEKDVKVFPWKILSHALKKIIGKYSASYSSTAGALPTPIHSNYASIGTGSDSGTEPQTAGSPQSVSDAAPSSTYGTNLTVPAYSPQTDQSGRPISDASDYRVMLPAISQSFVSVAPSFSYPALCQPQSQSGFSAPVSRPSWEMSSLVAPALSGATSNGGCYSYIAPVPFTLPDVSQAP